MVDVRGNLKKENIKVDGLIENGLGEVYVDEDGEVSLTVYNEKYCAKKNIDDREITIEKKTSNNCIVSDCSQYVFMLGKAIKSCDVQAIDPDENMRYVGPNPNNYVKFNNELWRIIGIFDGQAKIIKNGFYIKEASYDDNGDGIYSNNWYTSILNALLNDEEVETSFINIIKKNNPTSYNYIDLDHVWNIGGASNYENLARSDFYHAERSENISLGMTDSVWTGAVGLIYPSDYGYSTSGNKETCDSTVMSNWSLSSAYEECAKNSWLYKKYLQWTLTAKIDPTVDDYHILLDDAGDVSFCMLSSCASPIRPVLYLKNNIKIVAGKGTSEEPFELGI